MPAIPIILGAAQVAGGIQQNNQAQAAQASQDKANNTQIQLAKQQFELDKQRFGWDQATADREWNMRLQQMGINQESAKNYEASITPGMTQEQSYQTATDILNPMYDRQMKNTLDNQNRTALSRGFFGQAPQAELDAKAAADVLSAKNANIANLGNDLYQQSQNRAAQEKQFGIGAFGQYGDVTPIDTTPVTTPSVPTPTGNQAAPKKKSSTPGWMDSVFDPLNLSGGNSKKIGQHSLDPLNISGWFS